MKGPLRVWVAGTPKPQGSKRAFVVKSKDGATRAVVVDTNKTPLRDWRSDVIAALRDAWAGQDPIDEAVFVRLEFWLPRPKSAKAPFPSGRVGDVDKLARTCLDALEISGVLVDDARVVDLSVTKTYPPQPSTQPGVHITVDDTIPF